MPPWSPRRYLRCRFLAFVKSWRWPSELMMMDGQMATVHLVFSFRLGRVESRLFLIWTCPLWWVIHPRHLPHQLVYVFCFLVASSIYQWMGFVCSFISLGLLFWNSRSTPSSQLWHKYRALSAIFSSNTHCASYMYIHVTLPCIFYI